jgi:hypothetical protein
MHKSRPGAADLCIEALRTDLPDKVDAGYVVHPGDASIPLGPHASALPFAAL